MAATALQKLETPGEPQSSVIGGIGALCALTDIPPIQGAIWKIGCANTRERIN